MLAAWGGVFLEIKHAPTEYQRTCIHSSPVSNDLDGDLGRHLEHELMLPPPGLSSS